MRALIGRGWCVLVALIAYPVAVLAAGGAVDFRLGVALSQTIALLAGLLVLPRRLSPVRADGLGAAVVTTVAWVVVGQGIWSVCRFALGFPGTEGALVLRFAVVAQAVLGAVGIGGLSLLRVRFVSVLATAACLPLFVPAFPQMFDLRPRDVAGHLALGLFILASAATYRLLRGRLHFNGYFLALQAVAAVQWVVATHVIWILALCLAGIANEVPRLLPVATFVVQLAVSVMLPVAYLALTRRLSLERLLCGGPVLGEADAAAAVVKGRAGGNRTAWIISYTGVSNEPRVRRQAAALIEDGWRVVVCGFDGHSPRPPEWYYIHLPASDAFSPRIRQLLWLLRSSGTVLAAYGRPHALARTAALLSHWGVANWLYMKLYLLAVAEQAPELKPDLVISHDYYTADAGYEVARSADAKFSVDCHEYAAEQHSNDRQWVRWTRPGVVAVQAYYLARADVVTTVCDGIAELLDRDHALKRPVVVVRNVPLKNIQPYRPVGERIKVLYHGGISHARQLHVAIHSMRLWRPEFDLVIRGNGDPAYIAELRRLVERFGLTGRVHFEPAVPFDRIVPEANTADIGYYSYASYSPQIEFSLPNKFFEYLMAGLSICVSNLTEVARLTREFRLGKLIPQHTPEAIAETINSFTRAEIEECKQAALKAAQILNWDHEQQRLVAAYNDLFDSVVTVDGFEPAPARSGVAVAT